MIIIKIINQKVVQVALSSQSSGQLFSSIIATRNHKPSLTILARTLTQSTHQNQKVTNANNQQLIPIARNISFRQCRHQSENINSERNSQHSSSFSISATSPDPSTASSHFISASELDSSLFTTYEAGTQYPAVKDREESPFETLKRRAKDAVDKRELASKSNYYGQIFNETPSAITSNERKLVVLMSWLEAKEKHIEKYRQFYLDRGFDVLNVKTSPLDLLLPNVGAKKISKDFVRFLVDKQYSGVVLHGFSVGGYMFGQVLLDLDRQEEEVRNKVLNSIRGVLFDSIVPFEGICVGVANSITRNQFGAKLLEQLLRLYLKLGHNVATKYYQEASDKVWGGPLKCPSLFFMSKDDKISDHRIVERLVGTWDSLGLDARKKLFDSSPHVQLFTKHHNKYVEEVESFLKELRMY